jgi:very-short-patch-repair endonuclease
MAAVLACGEGAVVSHRSAAVAWGLLPDRPSALIDISIPSDAGRRRRAGIRLHRRPRLGPKDVSRHREVPVTTATRTIADLGEAASRADVRRAQRQAAVLGLHFETGAEHDSTRSELESMFLQLCRRYGLPAPEVNVRIAGILVDFAWRERQLIVETDGYRYHRGRASFEQDRARDLHLRSSGFEVIRLTYDQVARRPKETACVLRKVLTARAPDTAPAVS